MNQIKVAIDQILDGIDISEDQKNALMGLYSLSSIKLMVELLAGFSETNPEYFTRIMDFLSREISILSESEKEIFDKILAEENTKIFITTMQVFTSNLPEDMRKKIQENLQKVNLESISST